MADRQIRILHVLGTMNPGGVETWLLHVLRFIDRSCFQFDICTFGPEAGLYATEVEELGGRMVACPIGRNLWSFRNRFRQILRQGNYDIVHSHVTLFSGTVLRWAKAQGVPVRIAHSHTSQDDKPNTLARRCYRRLMKSWINRYATHGLAASRLAAEALFGRDWQTDARVRVLYYGIDLRPFQEALGRDEVRAELGIPRDATVVGHVGRFVAAKNHRFFLEIARDILKVRPDVHFLLVGDGPLRSEIESRAASMRFNGNIHFTGTRTDVPRLMRGAMDVFVFPSLWEGLPVTVLEAQAAALNCVLSDAVSAETVICPESLEFLPLSAGSSRWAAQVMEMLAEPRAEQSSLWNTLANSRFLIQKSLRDLTNVYSSFHVAAAPAIAERHVQRLTIKNKPL